MGWKSDIVMRNLIVTTFLSISYGYFSSSVVLKVFSMYAFPKRFMVRMMYALLLRLMAGEFNKLVRLLAHWHAKSKNLTPLTRWHAKLKN